MSFPKGNSVNCGIPKEFYCVSYEDYDYFVSLLVSVGQGCYIAKADIESAFRIIPVHPNDYHLLGFCIEGQYYYDRCLPMGCSMSCRVFELFSTALQWLLNRTFRVLSMSHILDDFIFLSPTKSLCQLYLQHFFTLAEHLSIPVKHKKTVLPATCVVVHDIEVDTLTMRARLPQDKLDAALLLVRSFQRRKKVILRQLQSLIGTLNFACKVIVPGRPFLRRLIDLTRGMVKAA